MIEEDGEEGGKDKKEGVLECVGNELYGGRIKR